LDRYRALLSDKFATKEKKKKTSGAPADPYSIAAFCTPNPKKNNKPVLFIAQLLSEQ
jgi:hypothetical protein